MNSGIAKPRTGFAALCIAVFAVAMLAHAAAAQAQTVAPETPMPLSPAGKFAAFAKQAYDPLALATAGFDAGIGQAQNSPQEYGQGGDGYGKRLGAALADQTSNAFFGGFVLPTLLRQDPRYYRRAAGSFGTRVGYAISRTLVTRHDDGRPTFNSSVVGGALIAGALANTYYPEQDRGVGLTLSRAAFGLLGATAINLRKEFWPDVSRKLFHSHAAASAPAAP